MSDTSEIKEVGIAEMKIDSAPAILVTRGLGSCLGIMLYEPYLKVGSLAHPMLPCMTDARIKTNPCKFVDTVIPLMIDKMAEKGCNVIHLRAKLAGGAHMFSSIPENSAFNIGARNAQVAIEKLGTYKIKIEGQDIGGNYGRTIFFNIDAGKVIIKTLFQGEKEL